MKSRASLAEAGRSRVREFVRTVPAAVLPIAALTFLWLPVVVLVVHSFSGATKAHLWGGFSTRWWTSLADDTEVGLRAANSLVVAVTVAVLATVLGTTLALGLERRGRRRGAAALEVAVTSPILMPDLVQAVSILILYETASILLHATAGFDLRRGRWSIALAHTAFAASYVALLVRTRLRTIPRALEEAALDLGATPAEAFRRVTLPLLAPAVVGGGVLAFTLSLDEYVIAYFTAGAGSDTLPVWIASTMRRAQATPVVNVVSTIAIVGSVLLVAASVLLQRRRR
jgi:ABC-type spermidine/putrescine transport system permease subunit II